jgi:hypothetical protein
MAKRKQFLGNLNVAFDISDKVLSLNPLHFYDRIPIAADSDSLFDELKMRSEREL